MTVRRTITIHRPPADLYAFWRNIDNLAKLVPGGASARVVSDRRSHWCTTGPAGKRFNWEAELVEDEPERIIAWRSVPGGDVENSGEVRFEPASDGATRVALQIEYALPGGLIGSLVSKLVNQQVEEEIDAGLDRAKHQLERR
jgi:uncharacterized membrane protein